MQPFAGIDGKVALVTGASEGLGRHMAAVLARAGARVAVAARNAERLRSLVEDIESFDGRALAVPMDMRQAATIREGVDIAETELGPIGILVNNAGIAVQRPAHEMTEAEFDSVIDTNLKGAWHCAQAVGRRMIEHGHGGRIVNVASLLALRVYPQLAAYAMSKAGLVQMTKALALEWARYDVQVNALCPGYIETEMNAAHWRTPAGERFVARFPRRRVGRPENLDGSLLLLCSDTAAFMTGSVVQVDDGQALG